jgi:hypothetical protein
MEASPRWTRVPVVHDQWTKAHGFLSSKINPKINYPVNFAKRPLGFFVIKPQSPKISRRPLVFKNKFQFSPSHFRKITKRFPQLFFTISS